jgi:hypothetical protein
MFQKQGAILRGLSIQRNIDPIHQSSYLVAFTKVIKISNIEILKYIKLVIINRNVVMLKVLKVLKNK